MSKRKQNSGNVVWAIDTKGNEYNGQSAPFSFYEIHAIGSRYSVMFYGACAVHTSDSLEDAKEYIRKKIKEGKY